MRAVEMHPSLGGKLSALPWLGKYAHGHFVEVRSSPHGILKGPAPYLLVRDHIYAVEKTYMLLRDLMCW